MKVKLFGAAVLCGATPIFASAQTSSVSQLDEIVVTPARIQQSRSAAIGDVTIIDKKELSASPARSLPEILSRHAGIEFSNSGGPQTPASVFLRGANANQTLVLVNGVRINSATSGAVNWNTLDVATIERVEVLRGAASSLYGSDAIGGVINVITSTRGLDRPLSAFADFGMGSRGTFKSAAGIAGAHDGWDYSLSGSLADSDGFTTMQAPAHPDRDGYRQTSVAASLGYEWRPGQHLGFSAYNGYNRAEVDGYDPALEPVWALTRQQIYSVTSTNDITASWQSVLRLGLNKDAAESREQGPSTRYGSLQRSYSWQNNLSLLEDHTLSVVLERLEERSQGSPLYAGHGRDTNSVGLIYRGRMGRHHMQASARNDQISGYGHQTTGSLAWDIDLDEHWQVGVAASTGFKAPTFNDLYFPLSGPWYDYAGNPDLQPEKSRNVEAHLRYEAAHGWFNLTAYQNKVRNLINPYVCQEYAGPFCLFGRPENADSATLRGVSFAAGTQLGNTAVRLRADLQNPRDDSTGNQLSRRAKQIYGLDVEQRVHDWTLGAEYRFVGQRYDDPANQYSLGGYSLWNLTARYDFNKNLSLQARWNNVFDKNYTLARGYNTEGSSVFVNLSWRM